MVWLWEPDIPVTFMRSPCETQFVWLQVGYNTFVLWIAHVVCVCVFFFNMTFSNLSQEFQKALGAKHSVYDTTNRSGRSLKEKTSLADDNLKLDDMLSELRDKWDTVCGKSVER